MRAIRPPTAASALAWAAGAALLLSLAGLLAPKWLLFLLTLAFANGLAVLGVVLLTRGGGATFGQGMFFAIGAYTAALMPQILGIQEVALRILLGTVVAGLVASVFAPLLSRYRGIFFAMLTLALSRSPVPWAGRTASRSRAGPCWDSRFRSRAATTRSSC